MSEERERERRSGFGIARWNNNLWQAVGKGEFMQGNVRVARWPRQYNFDT